MFCFVKNQKPSVQTLRKASLIKKSLRNIFTNELNQETADPNVLDVVLMGKKSFANVYVDNKDTLEFLNNNKSRIRGLLGNHLKDRLKHIPDLRFSHYVNCFHWD